MKSFIIFLVCLTLHPSLPAQEKIRKHHVYVSAGAGSLHAWGVDIAFSALAAIFGSSSTVQTRATPIFTAGYQYNLSRKFRIGPEVVHHQFNTEPEDRKNDLFFTSVLVRTDYTWFENKKWRFYSGVSAGCLFITDRGLFDDGTGVSETNVIFDGHVYLVGCEYSIGRTAVFLNAGGGAAGLVNAGITIGF